MTFPIALPWVHSNLHPGIKNCVLGILTLLLTVTLISAGIDGYSRMITYLQCSDNSRAGTVLNLFLSVCRAYFTPSQIRTDQETENVDVARWMLETRGFNRKSVM